MRGADLGRSVLALVLAATIAACASSGGSAGTAGTAGTIDRVGDSSDDSTAVAGSVGSSTGSSASTVPSPSASIEVASSTSSAVEPIVTVPGGSGDPSVTEEAVGVRPEGFSTITARITAADGEVCEVCLWLADDEAERGGGLMDVTDLGEPAGMAFAWDAATSGRFYMYRTPTPLSIAWFDLDGQYVSGAEMKPCVGSDSAQCDRYGAAGDYVVAIEMFAGRFDSVGIGPGSQAVLVSGTEAPTCLQGPDDSFGSD